MSDPLLEPVAAGQTRFRMQGIFPDARGIAVGREALLVFESIERLVACLGAYSDEASLDDLFSSVTIEVAKRAGGGRAQLLRCQVADGYELDRLSRLCGVVGARCYTGAGLSFVSVRDRKAPFGFDLARTISELRQESRATSGAEILAVDREFVSAYEVERTLDPVELIKNLALRPHSAARADLTEIGLEAVGLQNMALVLVAPGLSDRVLSYLWSREVEMSGVRTQLSTDQKPSLLLRLRHPSARVLQNLRQIPGVEILVPLSSRVAVELGYQHPIYLASASSCFPGDEMYLFRGKVGQVERLAEAPRFVDARHFVQSTLSLREADIHDIETAAPLGLKIQLRLRPTVHAREPRGSLVPWDELEWLRRVAYLLPPSTLASARLAPLQNGILILGVSTPGRAETRAYSAASLVPVGQRMVEVAPGVLVPDGYELWPKVRTELIRRLLRLDNGQYGVFFDPNDAPIILRNENLMPMDAAILASFESQSRSMVEMSSPPPRPAILENQPLGRFALWGFRGGSKGLTPEKKG